MEKKKEKRERESVFPPFFLFFLFLFFVWVLVVKMKRAAARSLLREYAVSKPSVFFYKRREQEWYWAEAAPWFPLLFPPSHHLFTVGGEKCTKKSSLDACLASGHVPPSPPIEILNPLQQHPPCFSFGSGATTAPGGEVPAAGGAVRGGRRFLRRWRRGRGEKEGESGRDFLFIPSLSFLLSNSRSFRRRR